MRKKSLCGLLGLAARGMHPPGHADAQQIKRQHGNGVDAHGPGVGTGADESRHDENRQNRVADIPPQKVRSDDAEQSQEKDEDR